LGVLCRFGRRVLVDDLAVESPGAIDSAFRAKGLGELQFGGGASLHRSRHFDLLLLLLFEKLHLLLSLLRQLCVFRIFALLSRLFFRHFSTGEKSIRAKFYARGNQFLELPNCQAARETARTGGAAL
jgi:hypothetical protein